MDNVTERKLNDAEMDEFRSYTERFNKRFHIFTSTNPDAVMQTIHRIVPRR